jgi:hypothetical protein
MTTSNHRWYHLTPARLFIGLLAVQVFLFLSERFRWFPFNEHKGWTVLIAVGVVGLAVVVMLVWGLVCLVLRRRFQFGVRSLLVFLVAVSVPLGWFAWAMEKAKRQREAVEAIRELGGYLTYDYQTHDYQRHGKAELSTANWLRTLLGDDFFFEVAAVDCDYRALSDRDVVHLRQFTRVKWLMLDGTQVGDNFLAQVQNLPELRGISITGTQISDNGLAHLQRIGQLEVLILDDTHITDEGLKYLSNLTRLNGLYLDNTQISDGGLAYLTRMNKLEVLSASGTQITDDGLAHLKGLTKLELVRLIGTKLTEEGTGKLQQALPNCEIIR